MKNREIHFHAVKFFSETVNLTKLLQKIVAINLEIFCIHSTLFLQKFREIVQFLQIIQTVDWFDEKILMFTVWKFREIIQFLHHSVVKWKIYCHPIFSSNQLFSIKTFHCPFVNPFDMSFTRFFSKKYDSEFPLFPHCVHADESNGRLIWRKIFNVHSEKKGCFCPTERKLYLFLQRSSFK